MGMGDERTGPGGRPCFDCGAPAVADCCRCGRPVCLMHVNKRVLGKYHPGREPYLIRFQCDECLYRYSAYVWPIALVCMAAVVALLYLSVLRPW
jgi:hypothetical protein